MLAATHVFAQDPLQIERQLWKQLPIWPTLTHNTPNHIFEPVSLDAFGNPDVDEFDRPLFKSRFSTYEDEFLSLAPGECTFSHLGDFNWDDPLHRQCKGPDPAHEELPPPTGSLLSPVALAVDTLDLGAGNLEHRVYVADHSNNRIQVFDFDGASIPLAHQMGLGRYGSGHYSYAGGSEGELLSMPAGITVDAQHKIVVADGGNHRIVVFNSDGSKAFEFAVPDAVAGAFKPNQIAITPGSTVIDPASAALATPGARILLTDWTHCQVWLFDNKFSQGKSLPSALPHPSQHYACLQPDPESGGRPTAPYEFSTVTGGTIDAAGHVYIADHAQNLVQVFDSNLTHLGWIGRPGIATGAAELLGPVGLAVDHLGRLGVIDSGHTRIAFYGVAFPGNVATATFQGQLDTTAAHDDFSMGLVEQRGTLPGLDEKGRFLVTDPIQNRVLRFELPEMGIVNAFADSGNGAFDVAVPIQKLTAVSGVTTTVTPVEAGVVKTGGPTPVPFAASVNISPGAFQHYAFTFTSPVPQATFNITATGNGGAAHADPAQAVAHAPCTNCDLDAVVYENPEAPGGAVEAQTTATPNGDWYDQTVFVRLTPTGTQPIETVFWSFDGAAAATYGTAFQSAPIGEDGFVDVPVLIGGASGLTYFGVTADGSASAHHRIPLKLDLVAPHVHFLTWTPPTGHGDVDGNQWHNVDVRAGYIVNDNEGGVFAGAGTVLDTQVDPAVPDAYTPWFTQEGRHQRTSVHVDDFVGHEDDVDSIDGSGGRPVNIDKGKPSITSTSIPSDPLLLRFIANGSDVNGPYFELSANSLQASASDPPLADGSAGSGIFSISNPGGHRFYLGTTTWHYVAVDFAGNASDPVDRVITVLPSSTSLGTVSQVVQYGQPVTLVANLIPAFGSGTVTFHFDIYNVSAAMINGAATATIPNVWSTAGNKYSLTADFVADPGSGVSDTGTGPGADVTVTKAAAYVTAHDKSKVFGAAVAPFDASDASDADVSGALNGDPIYFTLSTTATSTTPVGSREITVTPLTNPNYVVSPTPGTLTITKAPVGVTASGATITYGDALPTFGFTYDTALPGGLASGDVDTPPTCSTSGPFTYGTRPIICSGASDHDLSFTYATGTLTINQKGATLTAGSSSKTFGALDPGLPVPTQSGILTGDVAAITLTTTRTHLAGDENAGHHPTSATAIGGNSGSYAFTVVAGDFEIFKATPTVTLGGGPYTYNATTQGATCAVTGVNNAPLSGGTIAYSPGLPVNAGTYVATCSFAGDTNYNLASNTRNIVINPKAITVTADAASKMLGGEDPAFTYHLTAGGPLYGTDTLTGTATRVTGESAGTYAILQGSVTAGPNYAITWVPANFTINAPPIAVADVVSTPGVTTTISVLANDTDANGDALTVTAVTQPLLGGTVVISSNQVRFTPTPGFVGVAVFTYTVSDGNGGSAIGTVTVTVTAGACTIGGYTTYTQGGWGANPKGNNPAMLLQNKFAIVYPTGSVRIGGTKTLTFTSSAAIMNFLPAGGTPSVLTATATNPTTSAAGVFAGQVLALQLNVNFSDAGITKRGLGDLVYNGRTVRQILDAANAVLGGNTAVLSSMGLTLSGLNTIVDNINNNFDNGTSNQGFLQCP